MLKTIMASLRQRVEQRVLLVDVLAGLFGLGAWLSVNAMYTQLPILVQVLPESWTLASYIVILIQAANIGGIVYALLQRSCRGEKLESGAIYVLMAVGCLSLLLMAFFYRETSAVGGGMHSVALFVLVFGSALLACTSSVLFVPYMHRFPSTYLVSYMIGEGLSAFVPSVISLIQGVSGDPICVEKDGARLPYTPPPIFSTQTYLIITFVMQALSAVAFTLLDLLPRCQQARVNLKEEKESEVKATAESSVESLVESTERVVSAESRGELSSSKFLLLLTIEAVLMLFSNGLFPSIQAYSCEPYGTTAYHLAINLGAMANPVACYLLFFVVAKRVADIGALTTATLAVAVYILVASVMSPTPPLVGQVGGQVLVVIVWVVFTGLVSYTKLAIATVLREKHPKGLFWWGAVTQLGSLSGAVVAFCVLNYTTIFHSYTAPSPC